MEISVLSPDKKIFEGAVEAVLVPGINGSFEVLSNHAPIVSALTKGKVRITRLNEGPLEFSIDKGFIEVLQNKVALLVEGYTSESA